MKPVVIAAFIFTLLNTGIVLAKTAYCQYSTDCPGVERCIDRGDNIKVCTQSKQEAQDDENEHHQAYCNSSIDCEGSKFCKDRGDGLKVCM